jgi:CheY-like chemotaxis protein
MAVILVVDDEFGIADVLEALFVDFGHQVLRAPNGRLGLDCLLEKRPDIILLDLMMPVMDGPTMLRTLKADPVHRDIPVVAMSALEQDIVDELTGRQYQVFLRKPFRVKEVMKALEDLLGPKAGGV